MCYKISLASHLSDMHRMFATYYENNIFTDVVVSSSDRTISIRAHRLILTAGSQHFCEKLAEHERRSEIEPKLIVPLVEPQDLLDIVHLMYYGQVVVPDVRLQKMVSASIFLGIKGFETNSIAVVAEDEVSFYNH